MEQTVTVEVDPDLGKVVKTFALQENAWWDYTCFLTPAILAWLRMFRKRHFGKQGAKGVPMSYYPDDVLTRSDGRTTDAEEKAALRAFKKDIDHAIKAFELLDDTNQSYGAEYDRKIERGLQAFAKVYQALWD